MTMPNPEIEEFAKALVQHVRDAALRNCDALLLPQAQSPVARRWKGTGVGASDLRVVRPDAVDEGAFSCLQAIDQGAVRIPFEASSGRTIDLTAKGRA